MEISCLHCLTVLPAESTSSFCSLDCREAYLDNAPNECVAWVYDQLEIDQA